MGVYPASLPCDLSLNELRRPKPDTIAKLHSLAENSNKKNGRLVLSKAHARAAGDPHHLDPVDAPQGVVDEGHCVVGGDEVGGLQVGGRPQSAGARPPVGPDGGRVTRVTRRKWVCGGDLLKTGVTW